MASTRPPEADSDLPKSSAKASSSNSSRTQARATTAKAKTRKPSTPKSSISPPTIDGWPPLYVTAVPHEDILRGDGPEVVRRIEALCTISKDVVGGRAGDPMLLRPWQKQLIYRLFARRPDGKRRHRVALIGMPRKNGKSGLGSAFALDGLLFDGKGAEVYSAAAEKEQAKIVFNETKAMIRRSEELSEACVSMRDVIDVPATGSIYRALSAEAYSKEGLNVSRAIIDELHAHQTEDLWNVLTLGTGGRSEPMVIAITTAGLTTDSSGEESICYRMFQYGVEVVEGHIDDPNFFFCWWGAPDTSDFSDPAVWRAANPGYGDILNAEDLDDAYKRTRPNEFRTKRLNQWVTSTESYLPRGSWEACADAERVVDSKTKVVLAFDGSLNHDTTALMGCTVEDVPHLFYVWCWQRPFDADPAWHVPVTDVEQTIREFCATHNVIEIVADTHRWERSLQVLADEGLPMVEFPQSDERMVKATERLYDAVLNGLVTHDDNELVSRHIGNARTRQTNRGIRLMKTTKRSPLKIDLAVTAVMAFGTASNTKTPPKPRIFGLSDFMN